MDTEVAKSTSPMQRHLPWYPQRLLVFTQSTTMGVPRTFALATIVVLLMTLPELWAALRPPEGTVFAGSFWTPADLTPYWAAMRDAAASGSWLIYDRLTPEPHRPTLIYPIYVVSAKASAALGVPFELGFWALRILGRTALVLALSGLVATLVPPASRGKALAVTLLGSGLAFLFLLASALVGSEQLVQSFDTEWRYIEFSTFLALFSYPHLILALAALATIVCCHLRLVERLRVRWLAAFAAAVAVLALANPFSLMLVGIALSVSVLFSPRYTARNGLITLGTFLAVAGPFLLYSFLTFSRDPFWGLVYGAQNVPHLRSPSWAAFLSGYGLLLPLALVGAIAFMRRPAIQGRVLVLWLAVGLILMLAPVPYQRRLGLGTHFLLALTAFEGIRTIAESAWWRARSQSLRRLAAYGVVIVLGGSSLTAALIVLTSALGIGPLSSTVFERQELVAAAQWLAQRAGPNDVLLAPEPVAATMMRYFPGRAVLAHPIATLDPATKRREVGAFFDPMTPESERLELIRRYGVTIVVWESGTDEQGSTQRERPTWLRQLYEADGWSICRVEVDGAPSAVSGGASAP